MIYVKRTRGDGQTFILGMLCVDDVDRSKYKDCSDAKQKYKAVYLAIVGTETQSTYKHIQKNKTSFLTNYAKTVNSFEKKIFENSADNTSPIENTIKSLGAAYGKISHLVISESTKGIDRPCSHL
jgi:hypothetical protein